MPINLTYPAGTTKATASVRVYTRTLWSDSWVEREDLRCTSCNFAAAPSISAANFRHRYGPRYQSGSVTGSTVARLDINPRSYVKVVITPSPGMTATPITWIGIWKRATDMGLLQSIPAVGLEALLSFTRVEDAYYRDVFGGIKQAGRGITFNEDGKPNRSENKQPINSNQAYIFDEDPDRAQYWSTRDIAEYLLEAHPPVDKDGNQILIWNLRNEAALPDFDRPELKTHYRDVLSLLHGIISRHRLLSFWLSIIDVPAAGPIPANNAALVNVFTFTNTDIALKDGDGTTIGTIPANTADIAINLDRDTTASASLSIDASHVADRVTVIGAERVSVFSASKFDGSLEAAWSKAEEKDYKAGASAASDYPVEDEKHDRYLRDKEARASDRLRRVFAWFRLPKHWEQMTQDGVGESFPTPIAIDDDDDQFRIPSFYLRILKELPLLTGYDYADDIIADAEMAATPGHRGSAVQASPHDPLPWFVVIAQPAEEGWTPADPIRWVFIDQVGKTAALEVEDMETAIVSKIRANRDWSGRLRLLKDMVGFEIEVTGAEQHVIAGVDMSGHDDRILGSWDWRNIVATLAVTDSRRVQVTYPATPASIGQFSNDMSIEAGDQYQQIYVVPDTIVGINEKDGQLIRSSGGYLQDDRDALRVIAQRAYEWYRVPRYQLQYSTSWIAGQLSPGMYVSSVRRLSKKDPVGSVITSITYEFPISSSETPDAPKCSIQTAFGELDATRTL